MDNYRHFYRFAPVILIVFRKDKEAFWKAIFTPFLASKFSFRDRLSRLIVDITELRLKKLLRSEFGRDII